MAHFIVAIDMKNEFFWVKYVEEFTGAYFAYLIQEHFHEAFINSASPHGKLFLRDGNPWQNSMAAKRAKS